MTKEKTWCHQLAKKALRKTENKTSTLEGNSQKEKTGKGWGLTRGRTDRLMHKKGKRKKGENRIHHGPGKDSRVLTIIIN